MHILFVCNGNVCRSAIAERLTRSIAVEYRLPGITAESAGTRALVGFPVEPRAAEAITGLGGDPTGFRARKLTVEHIRRADLVLTMTENIRDQIAELDAAAVPRTFTLLEAHRIAKITGGRSVAALNQARHNLSRVGRENISDPVGLSAQAYCEVADLIADALVPLLVALAPPVAAPERSAVPEPPLRTELSDRRPCAHPPLVRTAGPIPAAHLPAAARVAPPVPPRLTPPPAPARLSPLAAARYTAWYA